MYFKGKVREDTIKEKVKKKGYVGKHNINKQTIYIAPKSKIESRAHYAPEPKRSTTIMVKVNHANVTGP